MIDYYKEYKALKKFYPEAVLLIRLKMFYETFCQDAKLVSEVCRIRFERPDDGGVAGFPVEFCARHLQKLYDAGHKILFAEVVRGKFKISDPQPFPPDNPQATQDRPSSRRRAKPKPTQVQRKLPLE